MSEFNYPIQIDDTTYIKTIGDYDYNRIFNYLVDNTDWDVTLKRLRNNLKVGIIDKNLERKAYDYSLLLKYFNNLANYCRKATTTERNNMYCNFISCLENSFVCRNNPQIIRDLADLLCIKPPLTCGLTKIDDTNVYYRSDDSLYKINEFDYDIYSNIDCYAYIASTYIANYYEVTEDTNPLDLNFFYGFQDNELLLIGQGIHNFYLDKRITRTLYFFVNHLSNSYAKTLYIGLYTYISGLPDPIDPPIVVMNSLYFSPIILPNSLNLYKLEIVYNENTDLTSYTLTLTDFVTNVEYVNES